MSDEIAIQFSTTKNSVSWWPPFFPNWSSWVIRHMCHSPFSHCDMVVPEGLLGASNSPKAPVITGNPGGVAIRPFNYEDFGAKYRMIIATPKADAIRAVWKSQLGKPFDGAALKGFLSDKPPTDPVARNWRATDKWFCAEGIAWAFEEGQYWLAPPTVWPKTRISPSDLLMIFLFDPNWSNRDTFWSG
jgi:hypothetical protein